MGRASARDQAARSGLQRCHREYVVHCGGAKTDRRTTPRTSGTRESYALLLRTPDRSPERKTRLPVDASGRLGRKDWLNAFIGVTLGYILVAALPPESARTIFQTFLRAIGILYPELPIH